MFSTGRDWMKTLHRDMGEFECGFSDVNHHQHGHQSSATNVKQSHLHHHPPEQLTSTSSKVVSGGWKRRMKAGKDGQHEESGLGCGGPKRNGETLLSKRKSLSIGGSNTDDDEDDEEEDDNEEGGEEGIGNEFINRCEAENDDDEDEENVNSEDDERHQGEHRRHRKHSNRHSRYSYGRTLSILYDRLWSLLRSAFKKEHKLDQMELFNEACAARLAANYSANKSRRRRELEILCKKTKFTRNELKLLYWGWKCACPNGILTESTFKEIYAQFFPQAGDSTLYAHYVYQAMFNDKVRTANGEVTFSDYASALSTLSRGTTSDKLEWIFKLYDINGDGFLTVDEIIEISRAIYALLGYYVSPGHDSKTCEDHGHKVFQKLDTQSKGYIAFDEFLLVCSKNETIISSMQLLDTIGLD